VALPELELLIPDFPALPRRAFLLAASRLVPRTRVAPAYTARVSSETKTGGVLREVTTHSADETIAFGRTLAQLLAPPKLVLLRGDLGAGKTTLVKGIAAAFDAAGEDDVTSPTFTLIHEYHGPHAAVYHIDLYRIDTPRELDTLALDDLRSDDSILLIEWGEKFPRLAGERDVEISLDRQGENGRRIRVRG
jgi:tRNA threonylcarbamoyladenosine biosynthesis protein TsaE